MYNVHLQIIKLSTSSRSRLSAVFATTFTNAFWVRTKLGHCFLHRVYSMPYEKLRFNVFYHATLPWMLEIPVLCNFFGSSG
jgi:hypothetical protein